MKRPGWPCCALVAGLLGAVGCQHPCCTPNPCTSAYPGYDPCRRSFLLPPSPLTPLQGAPLPGPQPPPVVLPGTASAVPPAPLPQTAPPPAIAEAGPLPSAPAAVPPAAEGPQVRLSAPETPPPPLANVPPQPRVREERGGGEQPGTPSLPVGIPQFAQVKKGVASGLRPILDGLDWLANNGYRTALHVHLPGQDDSSDRRQFEQRGLRFVSLAVSPETLSRDVVDQFNHAVNDVGNQPLFVYDQDGNLAGALWYLYFRTAEGAGDEDARIRAARLGFRTDTPEGRDMLLAVQKYLSGLKK
jgi:protein tyrosine phosphatase (PTP) superfamily phosphohydrolase (DUF442 family)